MSECANCGTGSFPEADQTCQAVGYQKANVCVPVTVAPFAHAKPAKTKCCGEPTVSYGSAPCAGKKNGVCTFTISQKICVELPVNFGATTTVGDTYVDCLCASKEDTCPCCKEGKAAE